MAITTMPLTFSPPRHLHHRQPKPQRPCPAARLAPLTRRRAAATWLRCAPDGEASSSPATAEQQPQQQEEEEFILLANNRSDFNEVIMVIDSPSNRYLVLDPSRTYIMASWHGLRVAASQVGLCCLVR